MNPFLHRVAVVTGGASGIGRALCEELGRRGATVIVADINRKGANHVADAITETGGTAHPASLDVANRSRVTKLITATAKQYKRFDYLFNNAGIAVMGEALDMKPAHWQRTLDVNLWGVIHGTSAAYQVMARQGSGHIVNTASAAGLFPIPLLTAYTATKHAVVGLSLALRVEAKRYGVRVSVVCPGIIRTNIPDAATYLKLDRRTVLSQLPTVRMMAADKCARIILRRVARNKAVIKVTPFALISSWLYRLHPALMNPWHRMALKKFRLLQEKGELR